MPQWEQPPASGGGDRSWDKGEKNNPQELSETVALNMTFIWFIHKDLT